MKDIKRLNKYVELVQTNIQGSTGPLKEFWERELRKTNAKIAKI